MEIAGNNEFDGVANSDWDWVGYVSRFEEIEMERLILQIVYVLVLCIYM